MLKDIRQFPNQIKYIVGNEAAERFSYYGMRSILTVFMVHTLAMQKSDATAVYHLFVSACYLLPLLGAYLSDRYLGKYKTIMYLSMFYCLGHAVLAMWETQTALYWGLGLIALGSGGIKPCVSAHVGDQFHSKNKHLLKSVFDIFYFSVNFGSMFSTILIPWTLEKYGPSVAFGIPGILMFIATLVFWMGRKEYVHVPPARKTGAAGFMPIMGHALMNWGQKQKGQSFLDAALGKFSVVEVEGAKSAWAVIKLFASVSIFWALFDQHGSSWVLQAERMNLNFMGIQFSASQISALNPIMVMVLIPLFSVWMYPAIQRVFKVEMTPLRRMSIGMVIAASSFVAAGIIEAVLDAGTQLNIGWQFIPYLLLTVAEVMISITGLEFAYTQAPRAMKSTLMSFWLLTTFAGNLLTAYISKVNMFQGPAFFYFFATLMAAVSGVFIFSAVRFKVRDYMEEENSPENVRTDVTGDIVLPTPVTPTTA